MSVAAQQKSSAPGLETHAANPREDARYALKGHSGASVVLHVSQSRNFVRKMSASPSSNNRLLSQIEKQRNLGRAGIPLPNILASGVTDGGCAFFDMAYVPGRTVADAVVNAATFDMHTVVEAVEKLLWLFQFCKEGTISVDQIHSKIASIETVACKYARNNPALFEMICHCADGLRGRDWSGMPNSPSHGDLTLENILLASEDGVVFIDCDEPWVSSYWLDIGKLFQDIYGHWCLRYFYLHPGQSVQLTNAVEKLEQLGKHFRVLVERCDAHLADRLYQLAALNLFRALPYAAEPDTASFICQRALCMLDH